MKRILLIGAILLSFLQAQAQAQAQSDAISFVQKVTKKYAMEVAVATPTRSVKYYSFLDRNKAVSVNCGYSYIFGKKEYPEMRGLSGANVGISIYGVYINIVGNLEGNYDSTMGVDKYNGYRTVAYHIGYTLPIAEWFSVTPIIGYSCWERGYYDGSDYYVDDYGVHNRFHAEMSYKAFDYGAIINFTALKYINIYFNITTTNIGGGIGFRLPFSVFRYAALLD